MENPEQVFIPAVGLILVLLLLLWLLSRRRKSVQKRQSKTDTTNPDADMAEPTLASADDAGEASGGDNSAETADADDEEAFTVFRRDTSGQEGEAPTLSEAAHEHAERLAAIEQEMLALRELYQNEQISRDVYVAETRALYSEAKALIS